MVCIDTYQLFRSSAGAESLQGVESKQLPYLQLTDGLADPVGFVIPGQGSVPLPKILAALPGDVVIGLECPQPRDSAVAPMEWGRAVLDGARGVLGQSATVEQPQGVS